MGSFSDHLITPMSEELDSSDCFQDLCFNEQAWTSTFGVLNPIEPRGTLGSDSIRDVSYRSSLVLPSLHLSQSEKQNDDQHFCTFPGCDRAFSTPSNRKRHELTHSDHRPHACDYPGCSRRFTRKYDLKMHGLVHSKEKSHKCLVSGCDRAYGRISSLRDHERRVHRMFGRAFRKTYDDRRSRHPRSLDIQSAEPNSSIQYCSSFPPPLGLSFNGPSPGSCPQSPSHIKCFEENDQVCSSSFTLDSCSSSPTPAPCLSSPELTSEITLFEQGTLSSTNPLELFIIIDPPLRI